MVEKREPACWTPSLSMLLSRSSLETPVGGVDDCSRLEALVEAVALEEDEVVVTADAAERLGDGSRVSCAEVDVPCLWLLASLWDSVFSMLGTGSSGEEKSFEWF